MKTIPAAAAAIEVEDVDGGRHELSSLWARGPTVLVFLRHFGWIFCREQAVQLHRELGRIHERGASLAFIGNGNRHFARAFRDEFQLTAPVYVDPERRAYQALGMKRGVAAALGSLAALRSAGRALRAGFRQGSVQGDAWQLGGVLLVGPAGEVLYRKLSAAAGDHAPPAEILAALEAWSAKAGRGGARPHGPAV